MLGFGHGPELILLLAIGLIILGPGKLPEVAQMIGKGIRELRKASSELQQTFDVNALMNPPEPAATSPESAPPPAEPPVEHTIQPPVPEPVVASIAEPVTADAPARPKRTRKKATLAEAVAAIEATPEGASTLEVEAAVPPEFALVGASAEAEAPKRRTRQPKVIAAEPPLVNASDAAAAALDERTLTLPSPAAAGEGSIAEPELAGVGANGGGALATEPARPRRRAARKTLEPVTADSPA